ncbi:4-hydroxybenzoate octaprenyltransferase [Legionella sp. CNM-4043-24]|uniref:4-hydroxybenzoate octaprenyltransferase n=1 Tax=Legionella sp. CNM-4043-24 TaxID=3421646 RepID=UPI00403B1B53
MSLKACWRLSRFHKPAGTFLLWAPTAWALCLANQGQPSWTLLLLFLAGTVIMRAAGCVMNDIADRHIDGHVKRTKNRPLASGELSLSQALVLLSFYLLLALLILLQLPSECVVYAVLSLLVTFVYPFCKRFIAAPQMVLGIAFSMGIPMAYAASFAQFDLSMLALLCINYCWIVAYDTQYAMADRADDLLIGVKSTAILFGRYDTLIIAILQGICQLLWLILAWSRHFSGLFYAFWLIGTLIFIYQQRLLTRASDERCWQAFASNSWYGLIMWAGVSLA